MDNFKYFKKLLYVIFIFTWLPTLALASHPKNVRYESAEHIFMGNQVVLKGLPKPTDNKSIKFPLGNGLKLSYGVILAMPDFYGDPNHQVSSENTFQKRKQQFFTLFHSFFNYDVSYFNAFWPIVQKERDEVAAALKVHKSVSKLYKRIIGKQLLTLEWVTHFKFFALAENCFDHFAHDAWLAYQAGHSVAVDMAIVGYDIASGSNTQANAACVNATHHHVCLMNLARKKLALAYEENAYANHFLTDRLASSHVRTPFRALVTTRPIAALGAIAGHFMHNEDGKYGVIVTNSSGEYWMAYGDDSTLKKSLLLDQALTETAFYFKQNKLVIRHAPIEATTAENSRVAYELIHNVTEKILEKLLRESQLSAGIQINHVIPHIQPGLIAQLEKMLAEFSNLISIQKLMEHARNFFSGAMSYLWKTTQTESKLASKFEPEAAPNSKHITVMVAHEAFEYDDLVKEKKLQYLIYRKRDQSKKPWTRIFDPRDIGAQSLNNDIDCGRHVVVMATILARKLSKEFETHAQQLKKRDMTQHSAVAYVQYCTSSGDVTKLLTQLTSDPDDESQIQAESVACVAAKLCFLIEKRNSDCYKFFVEPELTSEQKAAAAELRGFILEGSEIPANFLTMQPSVRESTSLYNCFKMASNATTPSQSSADSSPEKSPTDSNSHYAEQPRDHSTAGQFEVVTSPR